MQMYYNKYLLYLYFCLSLGFTYYTARGKSKSKFYYSVSDSDQSVKSVVSLEGTMAQ